MRKLILSLGNTVLMLSYLPRLEDRTLLINQWHTFAFELESTHEMGNTQQKQLER